ncbi:MAG: glycosyltransferase family 39 protein [bacterium]|nr:glycosyltransferase family 39 protein [bacterium]
MSGRVSFALAVVILLAGMFFRFYQLLWLPPGLNADEITDVRLTEQARSGNITVFTDAGNGQGREGLYHAVLAAVTTFTGRGLLGYHVFSVWVGMLSLSMIYALGTRLFGRLAGLSSLVLMSFTFWPVLLSRQVSREMLVPLVVTAVLLCLAVALPVYRRRRRRGANTTLFAALGVALGLALYVHPVGLLAVLIGAVFITYMILFARQKVSRRRVRYITFSLLLLMIMAMPYLTSSIQLRSLSGAQRLFELVPGISLQDTLRGLGGFFFWGDTNPARNIPGRPLLDPLASLVLLVGIGAALIGWRKTTHVLVLLSSVILLPGAVLANEGANFQAYVPLLPLIALYFGLGVDTLSDLAVRCVPRYSRSLTALGFVVWMGGLMLWTGSDLFNRWPQRPDVQTAYNTRVAQLARYLDAYAGDLQTVVCSDGVPNTLDGEASLMLTLMSRRNPPLRYVDCASGLVMTQGGALQQIILPGEQDLENAHWRVRDWLLRGEWVEAENIPTQAVLEMDVSTRLADTIGRMNFVAPVTYAPEASSAGESDMAQIPVSLGGNLTFYGYSPEESPIYRPGSIVTVVTYWRVDGIVPPDLLLFTHIQADPAAQPIAQTDTISVVPSQLEDRDVFMQITYIPLPETMPPGEYQISVGAYQDTSDERLSVLQDGRPRGDRLFLYRITVAEQNASN